MHQIPPARQADVARAFHEVCGTSEVELTPLRAGLSAAVVCKAVVRDRPLLLRVDVARDALHDPHRHYACLAAAAEAGLAPPLRFADPEAGVAIMDFIAERPRGDYPGGAPAMTLALGRMTARLQAMPAFPHTGDFLDSLDGVIAAMRATGVLDEAAARDHFAAYHAIRDAYPRLPAAELVASHNDMNPNNVLYDGERLWLVDWETACANDPLMDPAVVANFFGLQGEAADALLTTVFGEADGTRRARFLMMRQVCNMFHATMMLFLVAAARGAGARPIADLSAPGLETIRRGLGTGAVQLGATDGQLLFAKGLLNAVRDAARSPAFDAAARRLAA